MKQFCDFLTEHTIKIIYFKKKKMKLITGSSRNHIKMQKFIIFVKKNLKINVWKIKNIVNLEITVIIQENIEVLCIAYVI